MLTIGYELEVKNFNQQEALIKLMNTIFRFNICEPRVRRMAKVMGNSGSYREYVFVTYLDKNECSLH
jgi:hypothetical protein